MPQELCQDYADNPGVNWDCPAEKYLDSIWTLEIEGETRQLLKCAAEPEICGTFHAVAT